MLEPLSSNHMKQAMWRNDSEASEQCMTKVKPLTDGVETQISSIYQIYLP